MNCCGVYTQVMSIEFVLKYNGSLYNICYMYWTIYHLFIGYLSCKTVIVQGTLWSRYYDVVSNKSWKYEKVIFHWSATYSNSSFEVHTVFIYSMVLTSRHCLYQSRCKLANSLTWLLLNLALYCQNIVSWTPVP